MINYMVFIAFLFIFSALSSCELYDFVLVFATFIDIYIFAKGILYLQFVKFLIVEVLFLLDNCKILFLPLRI